MEKFRLRGKDTVLTRESEYDPWEFWTPCNSNDPKQPPKGWLPVAYGDVGEWREGQALRLRCYRGYYLFDREQWARDIRSFPILDHGGLVAMNPVLADGCGCRLREAAKQGAPRSKHNPFQADVAPPEVPG